MTWTWAEIISQALVRSGTIGLGQVGDSQQSVSAKKDLCLLLDEWDGEGLALPNFDFTITFNTVAGTAKYFLCPSGDASVRPESIITAICTISTNPDVNITMTPISFPAYTMIPVPSTSSQPWNYAINQTFPQMEFYLYPTPSAIYPITLNCKVKWADTVGWPDLNPFSVVEVPSGYVTALVDNLTLKTAKKWRLETKTMIDDARRSKAMVGQAIGNQANLRGRRTPAGLFSWNIITAGRNP